METDSDASPSPPPASPSPPIDAFRGGQGGSGEKNNYN